MKNKILYPFIFALFFLSISNKSYNHDQFPSLAHELFPDDVEAIIFS